MRIKKRVLFAILLLLAVFAAFIVYSYNHLSKDVLPKEINLEISDGVTMEFVLIDSGCFAMGSFEGEGDADETPRHKVAVSKPFYLGKYEVTQRQWEVIMGENPSDWKGNEYPVDTVSYNDCIVFTEKLSQITGKEISLPTESQWEYACRADTITKWSFGNKEEDITKYGWIDINSKGTTHPVGLKQPNKWGLYDMYGNISEWCIDWYQNPYSAENVTDPTGPLEGDSRVIRGGAWGDFPENTRSAYRNAMGEEIENNGTGLRCALYLD